MSSVVAFVGRINLAVINLFLLIIGLFLLWVSRALILRSGFVHVVLKELERQFLEAVDNFDKEDFAKTSDFSGFLDPVAFNILGLGLMVCSVSLLGCLSAVSANRRSLTLFRDGCILLLLCEIFILLYIYSGREFGKESMQESLKDYTGIETKNPSTKAWNEVMNYFNCCGINDFRDFSRLPKWQTGNIRMTHGRPISKNLLAAPIICSRGRVKNFTYVTYAHASSNNNNMDEGCYDILYGWVFKSKVTITFFVIIILSEIVMVFFTCWIQANLS